MQDINKAGLSRRTVMKGAAWSVPVIAAAVAVPMAAASTPQPNDGANYYWSGESQGTFTKLDGGGSGLQGTFSIQYSYRSNPWVNPPAGATMQITVSFDQPVVIAAPQATPTWTVSPLVGTSASTFTFLIPNPGNGQSVTFNFTGTAPGALTSQTSMALLNGGSTTWTSEISAGDTTLTV